MVPTRRKIRSISQTNAEELSLDDKPMVKADGSAAPEAELGGPKNSCLRWLVYLLGSFLAGL